MSKCDCYDEIGGKSICLGTWERDECSCQGDELKCNFYENVVENAQKKQRGECDIYYAHHQWKYHTEVENYEYNLIKRYFHSAVVFNPSTDLDDINRTEAGIMNVCLKTVDKSNILVFSSMDGCIGVGVYQEVKRAKKMGKLILYIYHDRLTTEFDIRVNPNPMTDRVYAFVEVKGNK